MSGQREHAGLVLGYCAAVHYILATFADAADADDRDRSYLAGLALTIDPGEFIYGTENREMFSDWMDVTCADPRVETRSFETAFAFVERSMQGRGTVRFLKTADAARWEAANELANRADDALLMRMTRLPLVTAP